jgi:hypothetical protein
VTLRPVRPTDARCDERHTLHSLMPGRSARPTFALGTAAAAALVLVGLAAGASATPAPVPADFELGGTQASADGMSIDPVTGSLSFGITLAQSLAETRGNVGRSQTSSVNTGLLGSSATAPSCTGGDPTVKKENLPPTLATDSRTPGSANGTSAAVAASPIGFGAAGSQSVKADDTPSGTGTSAMGGMDIPGVIHVGSSETHSTARIIAGGTREAVATSHFSGISLGGGVVSIDSITFEAVHRTGKEKTATGTSSMSGVRIAGLPLPIPADLSQGAAGIAAVNTALAPTGLRLDLPQTTIEKVSEDTGLVRVSPLAIRIVDSPAGKTASAGLLAALQPARAQLFQALLDASCSTAAGITVFDVLIGSTLGGGSLSLKLGGIQAATDGTRFTSAFGSGGSSLLSGLPPVVDSGSLSGTATDTGSAGLEPPPAGSVDTTTAPVLAAAPVAQLDTSATGTAIRRIRSTGVRDFAVPAAILGLLALVALAGAEVRRGFAGGSRRFEEDG